MLPERFPRWRDNDTVEVSIWDPVSKEDIVCNLIALTPKFFSAIEKESHERAKNLMNEYMVKMRARQIRGCGVPTQDDDMPMYSKIVRYVTSQDGRFFFERPELEALLESKKYLFLTPKLPL